MPAHPSLQAGRIGPLALRNRLIKTATYEGMSPGGRVSAELCAFHAEGARRGVGLTTVAYGAVEAAGRTFDDQLLIDAEAVDGLARLADAVHEAGGAVSLQLAHCGGFSKLRSRGGRAGGAPQGPSLALNAYGIAQALPFVRAMDEDDFARVIDAYGDATQRALQAGFDAVELHCGHGYLLSQFLSPLTNRRRDDWGGDTDRRLRLPLAVLARVRDVCAGRAAVLVKTNLRDGVRGGLELPEAVTIARRLAAGGADALVPSGGLVQRSAFYLLRGDVPLAEMARAEESVLQSWALRVLGRLLVRPYGYTSGFFFDDATAVLDALAADARDASTEPIPVALLGGVDSAALLRQAHARGFAFAALGRALLADPDFIERLAAGQEPVSRCDHGNGCVASMTAGVRCTLPSASPR